MTNPTDALDWYQRKRMSPDYTKPSADFTLEELRAEYDWLYEFQSHLAERIRGDADVHSLADYVAKIEAENAKLRECLQDLEEHIERDDGFGPDRGWMLDRMHELGIEVKA